MHKSLLFISSMIFLFSCKKEKIASTIIDYSMTEKVSLNKLTFMGNKCIVVGGDRFYKNRIYVFEFGQPPLEIQYPLNATTKEVYGVATTSLGDIIAVGYGGGIYSSHDSGANWNFIQNNSWREFQSVAFKNVDSAIIVGGIGFAEGLIEYVHKSGSENQDKRELRNFEITDVEFINETIGYLSGYGTIMKTTDGGHVWKYTDAKNDFFKAMAWKNEHEGIAVGNNGTIIKTTDGASSWESIKSGNNFLKKKYRLIDIAYHTSGVYAAVGEKGCMIISNDEGESWKEISSFTKNDLKGVTFRNATSIVVVGDEGTFVEVVLE